MEDNTTNKPKKKTARSKKLGEEEGKIEENKRIMKDRKTMVMMRFGE